MPVYRTYRLAKHHKLPCVLVMESMYEWTDRQTVILRLLIAPAALILLPLPATGPSPKYRTREAKTQSSFASRRCTAALCCGNHGRTPSHLNSLPIRRQNTSRSGQVASAFVFYGPCRVWRGWNAVEYMAVGEWDLQIEGAGDGVGMERRRGGEGGRERRGERGRR